VAYELAKLQEENEEMKQFLFRAESQLDKLELSRMESKGQQENASNWSQGTFMLGGVGCLAMLALGIKGGLSAVSHSASTSGQRSGLAGVSMSGGKSIADTLASMEGPEIFWGSDGVLLGHDESDIKGYDNFDQLAAALSANGIDLSGGTYTVLAPSNSAIEKHKTEVGTPITADILKYHVIEGKKSMDALNADQKTLNGGTLTYYRKFRKNWLDYAIIGLKSEGPSKSSNWPADVQCDNGVIHAIDTVLVPGAYDGSR
jgi:hypothetical protein